ncbi:MAG: glycosyl hydrolase family 18 protein, partial [Gammaproteobacteria bacterium]
MKQSKPIFYDEKRRRWFFTRRVLEVSGAILALLALTFFFSVMQRVSLPSLLLPDTTPVRHAFPETKAVARKLTPRPGRKHRVAALGQIPDKYDPIRAAFYVGYDPNSLTNLKRHYKDIDLLIPEEVHVVATDGSLSVVDNANQVRMHVDAAEAVRIMSQDKMRMWLQATQVESVAQGVPVDLPVMALVNNSDGTRWFHTELAELLASPAARHNLETGLLNYVQGSHEVGMCVDFEDVPEKAQRDFQKFATEMAAMLHPANLKLMIALPAADWDYDYAYFAKQADAIVLMNYDEHWQSSEPGPIAAQDWYLRNLANILKIVPPQKIIMGIANYGYDWVDKKPKTTEQSMSIDFQTAILTAYESDAKVEFDSDSLNPHYSYFDEHNHIHHVWFLDAVTAYNELRAAERAGVRGTALWRFGTADPSMWRIWDTLHPD